MESDSSAKPGSRISNGNCVDRLDDFPPLLLMVSLNDERDAGRRGVVGRDVGRRVRDVDLFELPSAGVDIFG